jgi:hypothetical protein
MEWLSPLARWPFIVAANRPLDASEAMIQTMVHLDPNLGPLDVEERWNLTTSVRFLPDLIWSLSYAQ